MEWFDWFGDQRNWRTVFVLTIRVNHLHNSPPLMVKISNVNNLSNPGHFRELVNIREGNISGLDEGNDGLNHAVGMALGWQNIEDHSQIVRFVSSFIAHGFVGISRGLDFMGVV
jgi:hypothetical protein